MSIHHRPRKSLLTQSKRHFASAVSGGPVTLDPQIKTLGQLIDAKVIGARGQKDSRAHLEDENVAATTSQADLDEHRHHKSKYREAFKSLESPFLSLDQWLLARIFVSFFFLLTKPLDIYTKLNILPKRHQLVTILDAAATAADVPFVQSLLQVMASQFRIKVDHQLLGLYMKALFQFGDSASAMAVLDEMRRAEDRSMRPTAHTYGIVLGSIKESGLSLQDVQSWLRLDDALGKDPSSWEALIEHRAREEDCTRAFELLDFALRHDIPLHSSAFICLIQRFAADQRYEEADKVISLMFQNVSKLTRTSYPNTEPVELFLLVFPSEISSQFLLDLADSSHYRCAVLADYYFRKGDQEKGREWLATLNERCSMASTAPNPFSVSTIINSIVKYGTKADLERFWLQSKRLGTTWTIAGFSAMVNAFYKFKDRQTAADIVLQVVSFETHSNFFGRDFSYANDSP
jgi:hypothetical protein